MRDLPAKAGSVQPDKDFDMLWERLRAAGPRLQEIVQATMRAQTLVLATDPDREGEAISWHVREELAVCIPGFPLPWRSCQSEESESPLTSVQDQS